MLFCFFYGKSAMLLLKKTLLIFSLMLPFCALAITGNPSQTKFVKINPLVKNDAKIQEQRDAFLVAKLAMKNGDISLARKLQSGVLKDYPLNIYLDYWYLANEPSVGKFKEVKRFIDSKKHLELSYYLKNRYINYLADKGYFKQVLSLFDNKKPFESETNLNRQQTKNQCRFYEALWHTGKADASAVAFSTKLYQNVNSYPDECEGLMTLWKMKGYKTDKIILEKFERLYINKRYKSNTIDLSKELLNSSFSSRVSTLMKIYDNPEDLFSIVNNSFEENHRAAVLAFKRYASVAPEQAVMRFNEFVEKFAPSEAEILGIKQIIARDYLGRLTSLDKVKWVDDNLPVIGWTDELKEMRARRAIWYGQWDIVYAVIDYLPSYEKNSINWRYWKGRSAYLTDRKDEGRKILKEVAKDRSFFGFLAAQQLNVSMPFNHKRLSKNVCWPDTIADNKAVQRFFELNVLDDPNASLEWKEIAKNSSDDEALLMADWALKNGYINYSILSITLGNRWDALSYRFPIAYLDLYKKYANSHNVSLSFLYGVTRQESMMNPYVKSPAGAVGLMQLMPATAKLVSKKNKWDYKGVSSLTLPENNIRLGSAYLREMLDRFDNNRILAAVAYNAGPGRVMRWKSNDGYTRDTAMYVENIPFDETRKYVQNVLLYDAIYNKLLTGKAGALLESHEMAYRY